MLLKVGDRVKLKKHIRDKYYGIDSNKYFVDNRDKSFIIVDIHDYGDEATLTLEIPEKPYNSYAIGWRDAQYGDGLYWSVPSKFFSCMMLGGE